MPREQAEVHARAMSAMFLHNFDALVTKDYLDSRFNEFETRLMAGVDKRFADTESRMDKRFSGMDEKFSQVDVRLERMDGRFNLIYWMQGITIACVVLPALHELLG